MRRWQVFAIVLVLLASVGAGGWLLSHDRRPLVEGHVQTAQAGDLRVTLRADDSTLGMRMLDITIDGADGKPAEIDQLRLRFLMASMDMGASEIQADPIGAGHFQARGQFFSMAGNWLIEVLLLRNNQPPIQVPFAMAIAAPGEASGPSNPLAANAQTVLAGQKLYFTNCTPCHGNTGKGDGSAAAGLNPRPANFALHMAPGKHTDGQIYLWIKNGYPNSAMPAWKERLSEEQLWQLVSYLRTFGQATAAAQPSGSANLGSPAPAPQKKPTPVPSAQEPLPPIIFTRQSDIWRSDGAGGAAKPLTDVPGGGYAGYPRFSPDGQRIAFVEITPAPVTATLLLPSSTLYVMNADGSDLRPIWQPAQGLLGLFAWAADGQSIAIATNGVGAQAGDGGRQLQVIRLDLATGAQQTLLANALDPAISPDGKQLAFLKLDADGYTMSLKIAAPDGSGARELIAGAAFQGFYAPRFSPDGKQIIVAAIGGPATDKSGNPAKASAPGALGWLLGWLAPPVAEAHGLPWDLWVVDTDGAGLRRLTFISEDLPMAAFAPDGKQVAIMGLGGIYLMAPDGSQLRRIDPVGDHGGLDWAR